MGGFITLAVEEEAVIYMIFELVTAPARAKGASRLAEIRLSRGGGAHVDF
jgi:hypothetical protein